MLQPLELLTHLKHLEEIVGRVKTLRNGPRAIDLDIIFYDSIILDTREGGGDGSREGELVIPHLVCVIENSSYVHSTTSFPTIFTTEGNVELLRHFRELTAPPPMDGPANFLQNYPMLAGLSRKSFLGKLLERNTEPQERNWATSAAVTAAVQHGVDVIRVHDVAEMRDVLKIADAFWR